MYRLVCLIIVTILFSCEKKNGVLPDELKQAERLMWTSPDSALRLLETMPPISPVKKETYATWCLLLTQARDKNYVIQTSDSLISVALSYFEKQVAPLRKAQACFYAGQIQRDMKNDDKATQYYVRARDEIKKTTDYRFACLISSNLGMLYAFRPELKEEAKVILLEANQLALQSNDSSYISNSFSELGRIYSVFHQWDSAVYCYEEAIRIAEETGDLRLLSMAQGEIAHSYIKINKTHKAISTLHNSIKLKEEIDVESLSQSYLALGRIYYMECLYDSSMFYLNKAVFSKNIRTIRDAYWCLSEVSKKKQQFQDAVFYSDLYQTHADSINKKKYSKDILEIKEKYHHEKLANENNELKIKYDRWVKLSLGFIISVVLILTTSIILYQRKLIKKERVLQQTKDKMLSSFVTIQKNDRTIEKNKQTIEDLTKQVSDGIKNYVDEAELMSTQNESLQKENEQLQQTIEKYSFELQKIKQDTPANKNLFHQVEKLVSRERFLLEQLEYKTDAFKQIRQTNKIITQKQWFELKSSMNQIHNSFIERLQNQFPQLSEQDIQYCCFIKLNLSNDQISTLVGISQSSVVKRKQRIRDKINTTLLPLLDNVQALNEYLSKY